MSRARRSTKVGRTGRRRRLWIALAAFALVSVAVAMVGWLLVVYPSQPRVGRGIEVRMTVAPGTTADRLAEQLEAEGLIDNARIFATYLRVLDADTRIQAGQVRMRDDLSPAQVMRHVVEGFGPVVARVTIPEGFSRFQIAERLESYGVCDADDFLEVTGDASRLGVTRGLFSGAMYDVATMTTPGTASHDAPLATKTPPEGASMEGFLFPDTYEFREGQSAALVARRMVRTFVDRVGPLLAKYHKARLAGEGGVAGELGLGTREIVTLASIAQKEAGVPEELPIIGGVFLNRLTFPGFRPRRLQADPTVMYGCLENPATSDACRAFNGKDITKRMLQDGDNRYNTYRIEGLPPGPIANPGLSAIKGILEPSAHRYLYFVAKGAGRHSFSESLDDHNRAVRKHLDR